MELGQSTLDFLLECFGLKFSRGYDMEGLTFERRDCDFLAEKEFGQSTLGAL
jgi:hypothetical protein